MIGFQSTVIQYNYFVGIVTSEPYQIYVNPLELKKGADWTLKQPKKPTRNEKEAILASGLNPDKWSVVKLTDFYMTIVHKETGEQKRIDRYARLKKGEKSEWLTEKRGRRR